MSVSTMMLPVQIHELIGAGIRAARLRKGWRQQDASRWFRFYGLLTWTPSAVGQVEAGTRKPNVGELILAAAALEVALSDLVPDTDESVDLGTGATMSARAVRALLAGDYGAFPHSPADFSFPGDAAMQDALARAGAERDRLRKLVKPIATAAPNPIAEDEMHQAFLSPTLAELRAADRLHIEPAQLRLACLALWRRDFEAERDARAGHGNEPLATLQARRGHATRAMLNALKEFIELAYMPGTDPQQAEREPGDR